jgi:hypothetical protein
MQVVVGRHGLVFRPINTTSLAEPRPEVRVGRHLHQWRIDAVIGDVPSIDEPQRHDICVIARAL